jgi:hypothetical protein
MSGTPTWVALYVKRLAEFPVKEALSNRGYEVYLPTVIYDAGCYKSTLRRFSKLLVLNARITLLENHSILQE